MFGLKKCKDCQKEQPRTNEEFEMRLEISKIKLHIKYICFIAVAIVTWLIATGTATDKEFTNLVSFAGTITSIILSVLAIIMSITGEEKSEAVRNRLEMTSKKIDAAVETIEKINDGTEENMSSIERTLDLLNQKIENIDSHIMAYTKNNQNNDVVTENSFEKKTTWGVEREKKVEY